MIPLSDLGIIAAISLLCAAVIGGLGLLWLRLARRSSILLQLCVIVVTAILSVAVGMVVVAQAMYVSTHDLLVTVWVAMVSAIVSLGIAVILGRTFTRNSNRLRQLAQDLGDGKHVEPDASIRDTSELAVLASDLALTSRRLAQAREEVATIDASRRELVAWISHDLRTPLAGLRAMAEALEDELADDPQRFHRQMRSQVDHLSAMVDDLFELSKIHSGTLTLSMQPVSLYDLVSDSVAELGALASSRSITLTESGGGDHTVVGDPRELARVIGNLLINAIQHSPAGSEISVSTGRADNGDVVLTVEDAGGGIPEADLSKIFQAGWRATPSRTPEQQWGHSAGAGLGLAIVQGIVEAHSGGITVRNVPGGCRFDVSLPLHKPVAA
ncbi:signal transduction histidine kinase [Salinibacterium sp. CAN_S4]|uniref:sensor histidine kinase n=1 Tax=Salinibacterium sp. CAN_S4 TaxID=2787727 RepID=UPI0018EFDF56